MSTTLRVKESTRARAAALALRSGASIGDVVDRALDAYEKAEFWRQAREALASHGADIVHDDPAWEHTVRDGLALDD